MELFDIFQDLAIKIKILTFKPKQSQLLAEFAKNVKLNFELSSMVILI